MPGRYSGGNEYRYGFQSQEKDDEITGVEGSHIAFDLRIHDSRIGRFLSIDPLTGKYPHNSPYAFSENRVIDMIELEGAEIFPFQLAHDVKTRYRKAVLKGGDDDALITQIKVVEAYANKLTVEGIAKETVEGVQEVGKLLKKAKNGDLSITQLDNLAKDALKHPFTKIAEKGAKAIITNDPVLKAEADAEALQIGMFTVGGVAAAALKTPKFPKVNNSVLDAAKRLGFELSDVIIKDGKAELTIDLTETLSANDISLVTQNLKSQGATSVKVNSGIIVNPKLRSTLNKIAESGKTFKGFKVTKTNNLKNNFILDKKL